MRIEIAENPNCRGGDEFEFSALGPSRTIQGIRVLERGQQSICDVVGVDGNGRFIEAQATKVADSGAGYAFLIQGGAWGIRLRPQVHAGEPWALDNAHQWGESFKLYGEEEDILYA